MQQFLLIGGIQGLLLAIALLNIKDARNKQANGYFASLVVVVSVYLLINSQTHLFTSYPKFFLTGYVLIYLYCPLYYLFVGSYVGRTPVWTKRDLIYLAPVFIFCVALIRYYLMTNEGILNTVINAGYWDLMVADLLSIMMNLRIIWVSWKMFKSSDMAAEATTTRYSIFVVFSISFALVNTIWLLFLINDAALVNLEIPFQLEIIFISMSALIYLFTYVLIVDNKYFSAREATKEKRYEKMSVDDSELQKVEVTIGSVLEKDRPYCDQDFSLSRLSDLTGIDKLKLSYTINHVMKSSFNALVNEYRVKEFIQLHQLPEYEHYNMLGLAVEAGFKSKSTFYKAFKEIKGMTPKEYFASK